MIIRVLLIDDHPVVRAGLHALLDLESDIDVVGEAGNGADGTQLAIDIRPDVVLTDLLLPYLDGVVVTQTICKHVPDSRIIVLTSLSDDDASVIRALQAGAIGYVSKDTDTTSLAQTIRSVAAGQVHLSVRATARLMHEMRSPTDNVRLTEREREVLREVAAGRTNKQIARSLDVALSTVKCHVRAILDKLDADSRTQAALRALHSQIISPDELPAA
ncbi:MAG: response regulator transcription factor [Chloroflexi bacterium]|nr:response regulator transcription factor [Chloroflexota bacterium]